MPIDRISRLRGYGVFRDFSWPTNLTDFGRYNLIYGWNGSGKTTLSRLLRDIEHRRTPTMEGEVTLRIDGHEIKGDDFPQSTLQIRVFNREYVNESIFPIGGGDVPPIFVVGKDSVEKQKEADKLRTECGTKEGEFQNATTTQRRTETEFEKHCTDRAKVIKDMLRASGENAYNNYNKTDYQGRAQKMATDGDAAAHRLDESARDKLIAQHRATPKAKVPLVAFTLPDLKGLADSVQGLLGTTVTSSAIQALKDDSELAEWVRDGLGLHKDHKANKCLFCEQPLPEGRLAALDAHFNAEYERLLKSINDQIQALETTRKQADDLQIPDRAVFYDDLSDDYDAAEKTHRDALATVRSFIGTLIEALNGKKAQPFKASSLTVPVPSVDANAVECVNEVIRSHNKASDDFASRVNTARDKLALDMIAETLDEYVQLRDAVQTALTAIKPIQDGIEQLKAKVTEIEREIREHQQPAEELNEDLKRYLGHGDIQLAIKDTGYSITRHGKPALMLSEGEMTAIALLYFLKSLNGRDFDPPNGVVVLDDPVSSLDANAMHLAFSLIRARTADAGQIFVLTHNFAFFRQVRNWLRYVPGQRSKDSTKQPARFFMLECVEQDGKRASALRPLDQLLYKYESEYHFLFASVYRFAHGPTPEGLEACYGMPNIARRLLESFLAFRHPDAFDNMWGALREVATSDEARKGRILNFVQTYSHGPGTGQPEHDPSVLGESRSILQEILALIKSEDSGHYAAMKNLVDPAGDKEGTA